MRQRLAVATPPIYDGVRDNFTWANHAARTLVTGGLIAWLAPEYICDPACGDASILEAAYELNPFKYATLSDISAAQVAALHPTFPASWAVRDLHDAISDTERRWDLVVLTEILEHLVAPEVTLRLARENSNALIASSPIGDPEEGGNHEHLWAWDEQGYGEMLRETGWTEVLRTTVTMPGVNGNAQIWVCR